MNQAMFEMQTQSGLPFCMIEQQAIQLVAINRVQHFIGIFAIGLVTRTAVRRVNHPPALL